MWQTVRCAILLAGISTLIPWTEQILMKMDEQKTELGGQSWQKDMDLDATVAMKIPELIRHYGYPAEEHFVTTSDGYILALHRIPRGRSQTDSGSGSGSGSGEAVKRPPVFLGHCLTGSSSNFAYGPPEDSLAYILADEGYDVWMPNMRGNMYSRNHTHLTPCTGCREFWSFSFEHSALHDYPASIDYILDKTASLDVFFVGYSMGTTQYLILLSERPEYNGKIRAGFLLGPSGSMGNMTNPLAVLVDQEKHMKMLLDMIGIYELLPAFFETKSWLAHRLCSLSTINMHLCRSFLSLFVSMEPENINLSMVPTYFTHMPSGASTMQFQHYAQIATSHGRFPRFDYGPEGNRDKYGQDAPPEFDLSRVTAPTALYGGESDNIVTVEDVNKLASELPNVLVNELIEEQFTHLDFILSNKLKTVVHDKIVGLMKQLI